MLKDRKKQSEAIKQSLKNRFRYEREVGIIRQECKFTMINIKLLMKIVDDIQERMGNVSRDLGILTKSQKAMLGIKILPK